jgi:hypothetical protein
MLIHSKLQFLFEDYSHLTKCGDNINYSMTCIITNLNLMQLAGHHGGEAAAAPPLLERQDLPHYGGDAAGSPLSRWYCWRPEVCKGEGNDLNNLLLV